MKSKYRNIFLVFGILAIVIMLCTFEVSYQELWENLKKAGYWFFAVLFLWVFIYLLNAWSWFSIIHDGSTDCKVPFLKVLKFTITGFALNYTTPVGLMGGEPYRIMELTPYVGGQKATSSVILYVMMHIFSHFCFWLFSLLLFVVLYFHKITMPLGLLLLLIGGICVLAVYFFMKGYKNGLAMKGLTLLGRLPFLHKWTQRVITGKHDAIVQVDEQIAALHRQHKRTFYLSLSLEFLARILGCVEIFFILLILTDRANFWDCILIQAFSSLFANALFFSPMQLGAREGGFALAVGGLAIPSAFGVYTGLITRVRELIWIIIGIGLMKVGNHAKNINQQS